MSEELTPLTAGIVSAFVSHNSTRPEDMVDLLKQVHGKLAEVMNGKPEQVEAAAVPAVSIKKSITPDALICLVCGQKHKMLKRHLRASHDLDPAAYREMFGLSSEYKLTAPNYSETRSGLATKSGLGRNPKVTEPEPVVVPDEPVKAKNEKPVADKAVRSHSKAEQTRRKSKASKKDQEAAESVSKVA